MKIEQHSEVGGVADLNWLIPDKSTLTIVYENLKTPQKQIDLSSEWMLSIELEKQAEIGAGVEALTRDIWDEIRRIDWAKYKFSDEHSPDLLRLIQELVAEDKTIRWNASAGISDLLQLAVERQLNDLPFDIAPILIQLLASPETPQKSLVSGLLIDLIGYSDVVDLKSLEEEAIRLKRAVCSGSGLYKQLMEATVDSNLREDLTYLLEQCST
ncbi:MAG: hypothetical protein IPK52_26025 [Chloroflexi bacterium]|nr:hypothetical protein [Chloroflexota bacterium]